MQFGFIFCVIIDSVLLYARAHEEFVLKKWCFCNSFVILQNDFDVYIMLHFLSVYAQIKLKDEGTLCALSMLYMWNPWWDSITYLSNTTVI